MLQKAKRALEPCLSLGEDLTESEIWFVKMYRRIMDKVDSFECISTI